MKTSYLCLFLLIFTSGNMTAQIISPSSSSERGKKQDRIIAQEQSLLESINTDNIGPSIFNGRVADIEVNPSDPTEFFVAYASGGLWYTKNNGTTFTPLFQHESVMTIGDIAVDWKSGTIYLGSGEQNSSRSSYAGNGLYKSSDKGKTWIHIGLDETHHISKVIIHPDNPAIVWVAALGHLYSKNTERGVFKSENGGATWSHTLTVNDETGASDIILHPEDPNIIYASTWQRQRSAWNFTESGPGSAIYKSSDGGRTWLLSSGVSSGFVNGEGTGRIGLTIAVRDGKSFIYAIVDNNYRRPKEALKKTENVISKDELKSMTKEDFLKLKEEVISKYLEDNGFPEKYKVKEVISLVKKDKIKVSDIATYNEDANAALFDTPVIGAEVYVSTDDGKNWSKTHIGYLNDVYYSYGYYFGQIRVQTNDPGKVYIFGVPILRSADGGKTWKNIDGDNVHSDHHALWLNPSRPGHLINGNDGGVNISYDDGDSWLKCTHPEVGQFYYVNVDNNEPYNVYGGTQDNGVWMGSHNYKNTSRWQSTGDYPYKSILGGDGMQVQIDSRDNATIYTGFQFGNYFRINKQKKERVFITPKHDLGQKPYRWNWQTPILLSSHNQDILYMGGNKLLRSMNQGKDFTEISDDLTQGGREGDVAFGTITTIDESTLKFGLIYAGTDDGNVHVTKDGGNNWKIISGSLPQGLWVSRVQASTFESGTVYVTLNGYRNDHFKPYVYVSHDFGVSWTDIASNLPNEPVNVIKEDPFDGDILYVGTDHGCYVSMDKGRSYMILGSDMPKVAVHDMVIQKKAKHLIIGTHGRSLYKVNVTNLHEMKNRKGEQLIVFKPTDLRYNDSWGKIRNVFTEVAIPKLSFETFSDTAREVKLEILNLSGTVLKTQNVKLKKGLSKNEVVIQVDKVSETSYLKSKEKSDWEKSKGAIERSDDGFYYIIPGKYDLRISSGNLESKVEFSIK